MLLLFLGISLHTAGQDTLPHRFIAGGYITNMQSVAFQRWNEEWTSDNLIHNRLNFKWFHIVNHLNGVLELRNRFITGESVKNVPGYAALVGRESGYLPLSGNLAHGPSYIFNVSADRLFLDYTLGKLQITAGRQRINWGQTLVWNPNDLFNSYSFFDFDYVEKPGCDAIRLQYYTSDISSLEMVVKADSADRVTSAFLYRFNRWNYDIQLLGGVFNSEDIVLGAGWSGNISNASFRGEVSYFRPRKHFADNSGIWAFSLGGGYTFANSFDLQAEMLYNQQRESGASDFLNLYNMTLSAKTLSFTPFSMMVQGSYPVTPLFNVTLSGMYFPKMDGFFAGPSLSYSLSENAECALFVQSFGGRFQDQQTQYFHLIYLRLKWSF
jgi:hypothetical protein